jgi:hypothetical protein
LKAAAGVAATGVAATSMFGSIANGDTPAEPATKPTAVPPIDRQKLVRRHNVVRSKSRPGSPLQVGNGNFAFGADVTGLQTFIPFNTMSQWGWYFAPLPAGQTVADMIAPDWDSHGRPVPYESGDPTHPQITEWIFSNPSRINLGRIGMTLIKADGTHAAEADLTDVRQELDLWTGTLTSTFKLDGADVKVRTACHPDRDAIAATISSPLIAIGRLTAYLDFPAPDARQFAGSVGSFDHPADHKTTADVQPGRVDIVHDLGGKQQYWASAWTHPTTLMSGPGDGGVRPPELKIVKARYGAAGEWFDAAATLSAAIKHDRLVFTVINTAFGNDPAEKKVKHLEVTYTLDGREQHAVVRENDTLAIGAPDTTHRFTFKPAAGAADLGFTVAFSLQPATDSPPPASNIFAACEKHWPVFWSSGGAIDLSESKDPRWMELERRIVLSQHLMATNEAGDLPPQESGLVNNGWFGKFHMEMYWWHAAHYALWDRWQLLNRSDGVYEKFLPMSRERAKKQGYRGARWTKMTGPDGRNAAYITNAMLIWQQPHPMFFAELDYRAHPTPATLDKWKTVLFETADFMASYAFFDQKPNQYVLGPPMAVVSENTDDKLTINPTFELSYWRFGLRIAQAWRERLGLPRDDDWDRVLQHLAPLPVEDGVYVTYEGIPQMWTKYNFEHPGLMGVFGWLPGDGVDPATFRATADRVMAKWNFNHVWGWDWPVLAMAMARIGNPAKAVDMLLTDKAAFQFDDAGLATGGPFPYFPSNGGLLYAVAMMAAGWDGSPAGKTAPGFPDPATDGGQWVVRSEGLRAAI